MIEANLKHEFQHKNKTVFFSLCFETRPGDAALVDLELFL